MKVEIALDPERAADLARQLIDVLVRVKDDEEIVVVGYSSSPRTLGVFIREKGSM